MVIASQLRPGMILKIGNDLLKVIESQFHVGQGKMPGTVHSKLRNIASGTMKDVRFRPEEKLEETQLQRRNLEFLYSDSDSATFMDPDSYEQFPIPLDAIGLAQRFLRPEMEVPVEFFAGSPVSIVFPPVAEAKVAMTAEPVHQQQDNTYKEATLENGLELLVPQFIRPGEIIRVDVASGKYVDRVRADARKH
jgi:elongation factor P